MTLPKANTAIAFEITGELEPDVGENSKRLTESEVSIDDRPFHPGDHHIHARSAAPVLDHRDSPAGSQFADEFIVGEEGGGVAVHALLFWGRHHYCGGIAENGAEGGRPERWQGD